MMKVGLTYDLRQDYLAAGYAEEETAEFDQPDTIEAIERTLQQLDYETLRIGSGRELVRRLASGERYDLVFNIAEGLRGYGREAMVPALLDDFAIPYTFSDPLVLALALHKAMAKRVVRDLGIPTADFVVVEREADAAAVELPLPLFAKPVAEGTGKGVDIASRIVAREQLPTVCRRLLTAFEQPVLVESFLPGREFTVGIVGTAEKAEVLGVMEVFLKDAASGDAYSYVNKRDYARAVEYALVEDAEASMASQTALKAWRGLGCRDGGRVDLRSDSRGIPHFIEVNPLAGLNPVHSDLPILAGRAGVSYRELISRIMRSAMERTGWHKNLRN